MSTCMCTQAHKREHMHSNTHSRVIGAKVVRACLSSHHSNVFVKLVHDCLSHPAPQTQGRVAWEVPSSRRCVFNDAKIYGTWDLPSQPMFSMLPIHLACSHCAASTLPVSRSLSPQIGAMRLLDTAYHPFVPDPCKVTCSPRFLPFF